MESDTNARAEWYITLVSIFVFHFFSFAIWWNSESSGVGLAIFLITVLAYWWLLGPIVKRIYDRYALDKRQRKGIDSDHDDNT